MSDIEIVLVTETTACSPLALMLFVTGDQKHVKVVKVKVRQCVNLIMGSQAFTYTHFTLPTTLH